MTDSDLIDVIAIVGATLLTTAAGLLVGYAFGTIPGIGAAAGVLGALLLLYAIGASRYESPPEAVEEPET